MGNKKLTFEEVKSILKIEVDKSVLHIQHIDGNTNSLSTGGTSDIFLVKYDSSGTKQ